MKLQLKYFASVREALGHSEETWETQTTTVAALRDELMARGGAYTQALAREHAVRTAVDHVMCAETMALHDGAEVAFFPPVTGG